MITTKQTQVTKDLDQKKIFVTREFDALPGKVWRAWTESDLLDQWWAPKPWMARTKSMDFREGGSWKYVMAGPEGEEHWCLINYLTIDAPNSFTGVDAFSDEQGNINQEFPSMHWKVSFIPAGKGTRVEVEISFDNIADLEKIVEMGFEEGFTAGLSNLDTLLDQENI
jgi:uncharacterized protein YndB with AHSA1/START domain